MTRAAMLAHSKAHVMRDRVARAAMLAHRQARVVRLQLSFENAAFSC